MIVRADNNVLLLSFGDLMLNVNTQYTNSFMSLRTMQTKVLEYELVYEKTSFIALTTSVVPDQTANPRRLIMAYTAR